jgi:hypothetical protein
MTIATRIEKAFGADLTANPATWTWTDISAYALGEVSVTAGRSDEAGTTQPARCVFRLRNTDGRFSPRLPSSPYYPNVRRQTPVRVSLNPGTGYVQRFQGYVDEIVPSWPSGNSEYAEVAVTASGSLRRLGQGSKPLRSALYRSTAASSPTAYWPLEDLSGATQGASITGDSPPFFSTGPGPVSFGSPAGSFPGSAGSVDLRGNASAGGALMNATVRSSAFSASSWQFEITACRASVGTVTPNVFVVIQTDAIPSMSLATNTVLADGKAHHFAYQFHQSGSDIAIDVYLDGSFDHTSTLTSQTLGRPTSIGIGQFTYIADDMPLVAHAAFFSSLSSPATRSLAANGFSGETADARLTRLCAEEGVAVSISGSSAARMGAQGIDTFINLCRACESADGGLLYDGAGPGLSYLTRTARYNIAVSMALDTKRQQVKLPFMPVEDDQRVRNDWTVSRPDGSSARFVDTANVAVNGRYDASATINIQGDPDLFDHAAWLAHLGTPEEMRVPGLSLQLIDRPELWAAWLATTVGGRLTVANLPAQYPPGILDMIVEGYTETWDSSSWRVDLNTSPMAPWRVWTVEDATNGRLGTASATSSTLTAGVNAGATSLSVATSDGPLWVQSALRPTRFPLDITIAGWQVTVTAIIGSSSPQTFTVQPVPAALAINAPVTLWRPAALSL